MRIPISPLLYGENSDPVETRYMRGDTHTVNNLTAYVLNTTQSNTAKFISTGYPGTPSMAVRSSIYVHHENGSATGLTADGVAQVVRTWSVGTTEGIQNATWNCPETALVLTDSIRVLVLVQCGPIEYSVSVNFTTEQLGASQLDAATWTFSYYTKYVGGSPPVPAGTGYFYWGTVTYNSLIDGFTWTGFVDTTSPTYSNVSTNTTLAGQPCQFSVLWNDNVNVSEGVFGTNNTGSWVNESLTFSAFYNSTAAWGNVTKILNFTTRARVEWQVWCKDTSDNWNTTGLRYLMIDYEDFETYTEVDVAANRIQKTSYHVDHIATRNESTYLYKDKGVDYFGINWEHYVDIKVVNATPDGVGIIWMLANMVGDWQEIQDASGDCLLVWFDYYSGPPPYYTIQVFERRGASGYGSSTYTITNNTMYYLIIFRNDTSFTCKIYSDSERTTLLATRSLTLHDNHPSHRYIYACDTYNTNANGYESINVIENLYLKPTVVGYALNMRAMDWDLTDAIANAYVYIKNDTASYVKTSDAYGWANWTAVSGTVYINVSYYGFLVNGSFSITVNSDTALNVRCNLYDVYVKVLSNTAVLYGANVTVFNASISQANKIQTNFTNQTGYAYLLNLPNNTLTVTIYDGVGNILANTSRSITSDEQVEVVTITQNYVNVQMPTIYIFSYATVIILSRKRKEGVKNKNEDS